MKGINQAELEKKLDLVIQKLMNLGLSLIHISEPTRP